MLNACIECHAATDEESLDIVHEHGFVCRACVLKIVSAHITDRISREAYIARIAKEDAEVKEVLSSLSKCVRNAKKLANVNHGPLGLQHPFTFKGGDH